MGRREKGEAFVEVAWRTGAGSWEWANGRHKLLSLGAGLGVPSPFLGGPVVGRVRIFSLALGFRQSGTEGVSDPFQL